MCSNALNSREKPAVSPMSGSPTFDTGKKNKTETGEFNTPPRPADRRSNKRHPIIVYYTSKNPCRVSHARRPVLKVKDAVKCILCIGSANNKGAGSFRYKHCLNFASFELFMD